MSQSWQKKFVSSPAPAEIIFSPSQTNTASLRTPFRIAITSF
ncbi:MAG: hypothetical protein ABSD78_19735 [Acidimicrobiales bacterium]